MAAHPRSGHVTAGIALIVVGLAGLGVLLVFVWSAGGPFPWQGDYGSLGERIFLTGTDASGRPIPRSGGKGMMNTAQGCADCHGRDGKGRTVSMMMGSIETPDIRWSTLTAPLSPEGKSQTPLDKSSFARMVTEGIEPDGERLKPPMPLWQLTDAEVRALIQYLQTL